MRFRGNSIRRRIGALALVPLVSLVSVWAYATAVTVGDARKLLADTAATDDLREPAQQLLEALQQERRESLVVRGDPRNSASLSRLRTAREATDAAAERVSAGVSDAGDLGDRAEDALVELVTSLDGLDRLRSQVTSGTVSRTDALDDYSAIIDHGVRLLFAVQPVTTADLDRHGHAVAGIAQERELLAEEDALIAGALASPQVADRELRRLEQLRLLRDMAYDAYRLDLPEKEQRAHDSFWHDGLGRMLVTTEQRLLDHDAVSLEQWNDASGAVLAELGAQGAAAESRYQQAADAARTGALLRAGLVAGGGLLAVVVSALVALRLGRGHLRELRTLSREATDAADVRLPGVRRRLAAGERVDAETEAPLLEYGPDELGTVGRALNTLQHEAVAAAVERATTRRGISEVFVNLARRSQVLLHRQLTLLRALERRCGDATDRADLIRLRHITARMRRHSEGLVVLSGAPPSRQWGRPATLMDLVRGAVAEVEAFDRVEVRRLPDLTVAGHAVPDLTQLVAELLENATTFSPPHTAVQVSGERVPHGFTLEIHDRGLGMTADALREANQRLGEPGEFELTDTDRLGLFVVARLARRHDVRVSLKNSPYGGTTAVALIPGALLSEGPGAGADRALEEPEPLAELDGPVDGPIELEAPVPAPGPALAAGRPRPPETAEHTGPDALDPPVPLASRRRQPVLVSDHGRPVARPAAEPDDEDTVQRPTRPATTRSGLPLRTRRTGHRPGVARRADETPGPTPEPDPTPADDLDAEAVRTRMAALQRGWQRGREQTGTQRRPAPPRQPDHESPTEAPS